MSDIILLTTDTPEFKNDLSDEIRLFLPDAIIEDDAECLPADIRIYVSFDAGDTWHAKAQVFGRIESCYSLDYPSISGGELVIKRHKKRCVKVALFRALLACFPDAYVLWGSLTGIRPTKLLRDLENETDEKTAKEQMLTLFDVDEKKYDLTKEILRIQQPIISSVKENDIDIYIGIPYCKTRCLYCSFPSGVRTDKTDMRPYIDALKKDIRTGSDIVKEYGYNVRATYIGGGTPTVLTEDELKEILDFTYECYGNMGTEFTCEAGRPDTITRKKLEILKGYGVGRVSVNPQTMNDDTLRLIGRSHTSEEIYDCFNEAKALGFCINMDIITCLPGEGEKELEKTLSCIRDMNPDNLTVHTLALKRSSKLREVIGYEEIQRLMPDECSADTFVEMGRAVAHDMGMNAYYMYRQKYMRGNLENVGYAYPSAECIYNIDMMEEQVSIMAHGAGSMSKRITQNRSLRVERIPNPKDIATYIAKIGIVEAEKRKLFKRGD